MLNYFSINLRAKLFLYFLFEYFIRQFCCNFMNIFPNYSLIKVYIFVFITKEMIIYICIHPAFKRCKNESFYF